MREQMKPSGFFPYLLGNVQMGILKSMLRDLCHMSKGDGHESSHSRHCLHSQQQQFSVLVGEKLRLTYVKKYQHNGCLAQWKNLISTAEGSAHSRYILSLKLFLFPVLLSRAERGFLSYVEKVFCSKYSRGLLQSLLLVSFY